MIDSEIIDKTSTGIITKCYFSGQWFLLRFNNDLKNLKNSIGNANWFAKEIAKTGFVPYLEFAVQDKEGEALQSLIEAFAYPCTLWSIVSLARAVFGSQAGVEYTLGAGSLSLRISNANMVFNYGLVDGDYAVINERTYSTKKNKKEKESKAIEEAWLVMDIYSQLGSANMYEFFKSFIPAGVYFDFSLE